MLMTVAYVRADDSCFIISLRPCLCFGFGKRNKGHHPLTYLVTPDASTCDRNLTRLSCGITAARPGLHRVHRTSDLICLSSFFFTFENCAKTYSAVPQRKGKTVMASSKCYMGLIYCNLVSDPLQI